MEYIDYYQILGISYDATLLEIKAAYRKLANRFHPDKNKGNTFFEERFKLVKEAYDVLSNLENKARYDKEIQENIDERIALEEQNKTTPLTLKQPKRIKKGFLWFSLTLAIVAISSLMYLNGFFNFNNNSADVPITNSKRKVSKEYEKENGLGLIALENSKPNEAIIYFTKALNIDSIAPYAFYNRALAKIQIEDFEGCVKDLNKAIQLEPKTKTYHLKRAGIFTKLQDYESAIFDWDELIALDARNATYYFERAIAKEKARGKAEACADYLIAKNLGYKVSEKLMAFCKAAPKKKKTVNIIGNRLKNGDSPYNHFYGKGKFDENSSNSITVNNRKNQDAVVFLVEYHSDKIIRNEFLLAKSNITFNKIPNGTYYIKAFLGNDWNPNKRIKNGRLKGSFNYNYTEKKYDRPSQLLQVNQGKEADGITYFSQYRVSL